MQLSKEKITLLVLDQAAWLLLVIFYLTFAIITKAMFKWGIFEYILYSSVPIGFLVLAESICLFTGNFDLSVGQQAGLIAMASAVILRNFAHSSFWFVPILCVVVPIFIGFLTGSLNGFFVGKFHLNPFLVTLGTFILFSGLTKVVHPASVWGRYLPSFYLSIGANSILSISIFICILVTAWFFLKYAHSGSNLYAIGAGRETSTMFGINPEKTIFFAYAFAGILCGLSAMFYTGFIGGVPISLADGALFPAFAGAVLGGVAISGGRGSVVGAFAGTLLVGTLGAGLTMIAVPPDIREVAFGLLVVTAIVIDQFRNKARDRLLKPKV